jgi:hypothetical protein
MATVTTDFSTVSFPRSRVERSADGVIAGYIHALVRASERRADDTGRRAKNPGRRPEGAAATMNPPRRLAEEAPRRGSLAEEAPRRGSQCVSRGGRVGRSLRPERPIEAL